MSEVNNEKGMNLLEVMVTMFMIALISCSLLGGFVGTQSLIRQAGFETRASSYAYHVLEDLRARNWAEIDAKAGEGSYIYWLDGNENNGVDMQAAVCIERNHATPFLYEAQVVVTWNEEGVNRDLEMVTYINPALREAKI